MTVKSERTGWRDKAISERHRLWGFNCPATDIDFLVIEYSAGKAKALIEYKHEKAHIDFSKNGVGMHPKSYSALCDLADRANLPFFVIRYAENFRFWQVIPFNDHAKVWLERETTMTEKEFVTFLYRLKGSLPPPEILEKLKGEVMKARKERKLKPEILSKVRQGFMLTEYEFVKADDVELKGEWAILKDVVELGLSGTKIAYTHFQPKLGLRIKDLRFHPTQM